MKKKDIACLLRFDKIDDIWSWFLKQVEESSQLFDVFELSFIKQFDFLRDRNETSLMLLFV